VPVEERIAVFDADGTLWCEQPLPVEADFVLRRLAEQAKADPELRDRQPWKAAYEHDNDWFGKVITEHYAGDDTNAKTLLGGIAGAYAGISVEYFEAKSDSFLRRTQHPTLSRGYLDTAHAPMVELLAYLEANGFSNHLVSGSGGVASPAGPPRRCRARVRVHKRRRARTEEGRHERMDRREHEGRLQDRLRGGDGGGAPMRLVSG
jgi:hypothetical protein